MENLLLNKIINHQKFSIISGSEEKIKKTIVKHRGINKGGMELMGFFNEKYEKKFLCFGSKEISYLKTLTIKKQLTIFKKIFNLKSPALILSKKSTLSKEIIDLANKKDFIILQSKLNSSDTIVSLSSFLNLYLSKPVQIHATLIEIYGKGILITGDSGIGKSETALELIKKGHLIIADDAPHLRRIGSKIIGNCPKNIYNKLEVRGLGIINIKEMFGASILLDEAEINYVLNLKKFTKNTEFDRTGLFLEYKDIKGIKIPKIDIPVSPARNTANLIEIAVSLLRLKEKEEIMDGGNNNA